MHETVMARDFPAKAACLVSGVSTQAEAGHRHLIAQRGIARKDHDQPVDFPTGISAHTVRQLALAEIRHIDALA
jgi:hypothetical protein